MEEFKHIIKDHEITMLQKLFIMFQIIEKMELLTFLIIQA